MPNISYVDPRSVTNPELVEIMERARTQGTPRPESQAIRLHHPAVMKAFNHGRLHAHYTKPQLIELGHFIAPTLGQQRFLKTVGLRHGEVLADTDAGLAPDEARHVRTAMTARTE
jgi:hypothetical protein